MRVTDRIIGKEARLGKRGGNILVNTHRLRLDSGGLRWCFPALKSHENPRQSYGERFGPASFVVGTDGHGLFIVRSR